MDDGIFSTERQSDQEEGVQKGNDTGKNPRASHQQHTQPLPHDGGVVQRLTDGYIPVICHDSQKKIVKTNKKYEKIQLRKALIIGDGLLLSLHVPEHLRDRDRGKRKVRES